MRNDKNRTKIVKKKKRRLDFFHLSLNILICAVGLFFVCALFCRCYNNSLSTKIQEINSEITTLETENDAMQVDIQTLANRNRVNTIASEAGMSADNDSVITISAASDSGD
jgi:cell division protein FtsL